MKRKICCIFNTPSIYRELIYKMIDDKYDCDWYFEDTDNKLKVFDTKILKHVTILHSIIYKGFYTVKGVVSLLWKDKFEYYLMMGHSRNLSTILLMVVKNLFFRNKKTILWTHGWYGKETCLEVLWKKFLFSQADEIMLYGNYAKKIAISHGVNPKKLHVIHNSLNYDEQLKLRNAIRSSSIYQDHFGNDCPVLVMIGRLNLRKKLDMLLDAVAKLKSKGEMYNIVLIGDGEDRCNLEQMAMELKISDQIWFYGACYNDAENANLIYNADMCVVPGDIGLTAMHALMFGCPAMSHDYFPSQGPEFEAIQEGKTGTFFKHNETNSLCEHISSWFNGAGKDRGKVRLACYKEIDANWNPYYQMAIINNIIQ